MIKNYEKYFESKLELLKKTYSGKELIAKLEDLKTEVWEHRSANRDRAYLGKDFISNKIYYDLLISISIAINSERGL